MNKNTLVSLKNVSVGYNSDVILDGIDLEIQQGDFIAVLGPNGCGKTTLLKTVAEILKPISGEINYCDSENLIGYVPQRETLNPAFLLTGYEVVLMGTFGRIKAGRPLPQKEKEWRLNA
jgi:ABC-type Mn2+/Zn2+ transport system ATPase subunit